MDEHYSTLSALSLARRTNPRARALLDALQEVDRAKEAGVTSRTIGDLLRNGGVSVVVPIYKSNDSIVNLVRRTRVALGSDGTRPLELEFVLVDDANVSPTADVVLDIAATSGDIVLLQLARNVGQHAALLAGVREASRAIIVTLDDDLQNPPEEIPRLLNRLAQGDVDLVYGYSSQKRQRLWRQFGSRMISKILCLAGLPFAGRTSQFRAFRTDLREAFSGVFGPGISLDVLLDWSTQRIDCVEVRHDSRAEGTSGYTLRKLVRFAFDTITGYSIALLHVVTLLGIAFLGLGLGILAWVTVRYKLVGSSVAGFPFLASVLALFSGIQMLSLGIIGQYLGRIHLRTQGRPSYVVARRFPSGPNDVLRRRAT